MQTKQSRTLPFQPKGTKRPPPGYVWNPLTALPHGENCRCQSGQPYRDCCLKDMMPFIPASWLDDFLSFMRLPLAKQLFITDDNRHNLRYEYFGPQAHIDETPPVD